VRLTPGRGGKGIKEKLTQRRKEIQSSVEATVPLFPRCFQPKRSNGAIGVADLRAIANIISRRGARTGGAKAIIEGGSQRLVIRWNRYLLYVKHVKRYGSVYVLAYNEWTIPVMAPRILKFPRKNAREKKKNSQARKVCDGAPRPPISHTNHFVRSLWPETSRAYGTVAASEDCISLRPWPTKPWRSLLCVSFSPLRLCVSFLHFELTRPSCLVVTCIFPAPYTRSCHQLHYLGLSTQITSRLAIAITGARASFPLRRHLASVKAQGRGESKRVDVGTFSSMVFVWLLPRTGQRRST